MSTWKIKTSLYLNYFVFAMLLNSVSILIQRSINTYGIDELAASSLEAFKDLSIAFISFLTGSFLPKIGFKKAMLISLGVVFWACLYLYFSDSFMAVRILFVCVGFSFAILKVSVYSLIGLLVKDDKDHRALLSSIESVFMVGVAFAFVVFPYFYSDANQKAWLNVYLLLGALVAISFLVLLTSDFTGLAQYPLPKLSIRQDFRQMLLLLKRPIVVIFSLAAFMYVMTEQGIMNWLPTFNEKVLRLSERLSVYMAVILVLSIAAGRYLSSILIKRVGWLTLLLVCLISAALMVIMVLPSIEHLEVKEIKSLTDVPTVAYVFPLIGFFLAPIYPLVNSLVLNSTVRELHSPMASLLVFFSAIGGSLGSRLVGHLFQRIGGSHAFYFSLIPLSFLGLCLIFLHRIIREENKKQIE
jgi:FHS family glucose/mannose:H+ symporter-like MFS transporter